MRSLLAAIIAITLIETISADSTFGQTPPRNAPSCSRCSNGASTSEPGSIRNSNVVTITPCGPGGGAVTTTPTAPVVAIPPCPPPKVEPVPKELEVEIAKLGKIKVKGFSVLLSIGLFAAFVALVVAVVIALKNDAPAVSMGSWGIALLLLLPTVFLWGKWIGENRAARELHASTAALQIEITRRVQVQVVAAENEALRRQLTEARGAQPIAAVDSTPHWVLFGVVGILALFDALLFAYLLLMRREHLSRERHNERVFQDMREELRWREEQRRREQSSRQRPQEPG